MINLFTSYYQCGDLSRQSELDASFVNNVKNPDVDVLYALVDDGSDLPVSSSKIRKINLTQRPTYQDWISLTYTEKLSGISVLANTDIYFDSSIKKLKDALSIPNSFLALSRWEIKGNSSHPHPNPQWSQDVWGLSCDADINRHLYKLLDFPMGIPRCDNKVAYLFAMYGWRVLNPLHHVRSYHLHESEVRGYSKRLDDSIIGGVAYVHPGVGLKDQALLDIDLWAKDTSHLSSFKINKSLEKWIRQADQEDQLSSSASIALPELRRNIEDKINSNSHAAATSPSNNTNGELRDTTPVNMRREVIRRFPLGYQIYDCEDHYRIQCGFGNEGTMIEKGKISTTSPSTDLVSALVPPVINTHLHLISDAPKNETDINFWQFPCATEKQALDNHLRKEALFNHLSEREFVHTYLALPWATYIDRKEFPELILSKLEAHINVLLEIAQHSGKKLRVHTVCQHIRWRNIMHLIARLNITDLHISHNEDGVSEEVRENHPELHIHSWPLVAVNIEDPARSVGITFGKSVKEKQYFASFIGAYMKHYRSDIRIKLLDAARNHNSDDIVVDLGEMWHFNKIVYDQQVQNKQLSDNDKSSEKNRTSNYNKVISDSVFSLCPEGAGPNTLRFWESMAIGSIPVVFADGWRPPLTGNGKLLEDCAIFVNHEDVSRVFDMLREISPEEIDRRQKACMDIYPTFRDAQCF